MAIALYFRVSTNRQELDSQQHSVRQYCTNQGYLPDDMVIFEDEGISGTTLIRPGFQQMLQAIELGLVNKIVTFELSRLSRDFISFLNVLDLLEKRGVIIEVPEQGVQRFDSSTHKLVAAIKGFAANNERDQISTRIKSGLANAKANGKTIGAPVGNTRRTGKTKQVDVVLKGKVDELIMSGWSLRKVATFLNISLSMAFRLSRI